MKIIFEEDTNYKEIRNIFDILIHLGYDITISSNINSNEVTFLCARE